ncbi:Hypothetical protein Minf_2392 [Methylacidiphilum infernorum V4]|uniref:Uncharacterized protein n=1 Tax=Methylacidiphilum infernorum (isolate V4) TaxID=481448 RepID=B3E0W9_METI4|nr:Hypothetical protein Minf_2392 [Methylacidiphilum infernorum V4]
MWSEKPKELNNFFCVAWAASVDSKKPSKEIKFLGFVDGFDPRSLWATLGRFSRGRLT